MKKLLILLLFGTSFAVLGQSTPKWMRYAKIAPNGEKIAFSYKSNLYYVAKDQALAIPLSIDDSYEYEAVWSPDSKHIAFASDRQGNYDVYLYNTEDGSTKQLTFHSANDIPQSFTADGKSILFTSGRKMNAQNAQFPYGRFSQLYSVSLEGKMPKMEIPLPLDAVNVKKDGSQLLYMDLKGYEDYWRKHHTSSIARDVWVYTAADKSHKQLTDFEGEDRNPIWANDQESIFYLSERSGTFNVWKLKPGSEAAPEKISNFDTHPVRFLSLANDGTLCYTYQGEIYTQKEGAEAIKKEVRIPYEQASVEKLKTLNSGASEMALSPNGKEIAFIVRGEVFVTGTETGLTKRITNTPEQERSVQFHPDGKKLVYAGERNGSWNLYETSIKNDKEPYFYAASLLDEKALLANEEETFQPQYSPDGKEVAYLSNRTTLKVINLASGQTRTVLSGDKNYSYSDGDQYYAWSPDGKWFTVDFIDKKRWVSEVGLVKADGSQSVQNITESGYTEAGGQWINEGKVIAYYSDKQGFRSHGSWGSTGDVYAVYLTKEAYDQAQMSKDEYEIWKELQKEEESDEDKDDKKKKSKEKEKESADVKIEWDNLDDRVDRLTISSSFISDMKLSPDGEKLYYLSSRDNSFDLWELEIREKKTKTIGNFKGGGASLTIDEKGENLFVMAGGSIYKVETKSGTSKPVSYAAEMYLDPQAERAYLFEHMWRQVLRKFYKKDLHGVEWDAMKAAYQPKLAHINNDRDFAEMMSELLGELNGSHTGCRYYFNDSEGTETASLGIYQDWNYTAAGIKIADVMDKSPLSMAEQGIKGGMIITKIDGERLAAGQNYYPLLNHKAGKDIVLEVTDAGGSNTKTVKIKGLSSGQEYNLLYDRWVKSRREATEQLSNGRLGYVHVRGMNSSSYREVFEDLLGRYNEKEAVIVDTRFNGGGWLHDDLATLLSGEQYVKLMPRGQYIGSEPQNKWQKPSAVIIGEGNYSDAHFFPVTYRALGIGKTIGMPIPGTATAVWWERQINPNIVFGIPQVGVVDMEGNYMENFQFEPDVKVKNMPGELVEGKDSQLQKAVEVLLEEVDK
ncbi:C-terminal processing protease CtpA/Prc, contains a PDZ domain [Marivirga sericea]|uniref:Tricorn protease homolog n=1 Tax=Marivirga sericea TaxID=1028 RepID=A0A1X7KL07_9BACT|nr:S41 family peptidase [Marivirga sericea]SMG42086.1 C-terminal processing protease CtpA/Prc, contains a PDZ domain [Marivirga sericea]